MSKVTAWSFSRWAKWEQCPLQFKYKFIDKLPETKTPQLERGDVVHKEIAAWLHGASHGHELPFPASAARFEGLLRAVAALPLDVVILIEQQWGLRKDWSETGWFSPDTWLRVILDTAIVYPDDDADVIDFKTGKRYGDNADQTELFGLGVLCRYPVIQRVKTRLWYLDTGEETVADYTRADIAPLQAKWNLRAADLMAEEQFLPKPNDKCKFCHWRQSNGGPCKFG